MGLIGLVAELAVLGGCAAAGMYWCCSIGSEAEHAMKETTTPTIFARLLIVLFIHSLLCCSCNKFPVDLRL
jgi:hypothetical protein